MSVIHRHIFIRTCCFEIALLNIERNEVPQARIINKTEILLRLSFCKHLCDSSWISISTIQYILYFAIWAEIILPDKTTKTNLLWRKFNYSMHSRRLFYVIMEITNSNKIIEQFTKILNTKPMATNEMTKSVITFCSIDLQFATAII